MMQLKLQVCDELIQRPKFCITVDRTYLSLTGMAMSVSNVSISQEDSSSEGWMLYLQFIE